MYDLGTELLLPLYTELVSRDIPLSFEECNTLGSETTFLIWSGRERVRAVGGDGSKSPVPKDLEQEDIKKTIAGLINPKSQNGSANGNANADAGNTKVDSGNSKGKNKPGGSVLTLFSPCIRSVLTLMMFPFISDASGSSSSSAAPDSGSAPGATGNGHADPGNTKKDITNKQPGGSGKWSSK